MSSLALAAEERQQMSEVLYRFYDQNDDLLYVGVTGSWQERLNQHYKNSSFFSEVKHATFEHHSSRLGVLGAEERAILTESPKYNKALNPNYEGPIQHFATIKKMVYSKMLPQDEHFDMVFELQVAYKTNSDWHKPTSGLLAKYMLELRPVWEENFEITCQMCIDTLESKQLSAYARQVMERGYAIS
jgi:hypothetical protein